MPLKNAALAVLGRARLLRPGFRAYETVTSLGASQGQPVEGVPLPPPRLIVRVAGTPDPGWFLESGRLAAETVATTLARHGVRLEDLGAVLDFGCGCGRVLRHLRGLPRQLAGSDQDPQLVAWCRANLPFAEVVRNGEAPPLAFGGNQFDLAYAFSVFTHLPEGLQHRWAHELRRVVRPGGLVLLTVHGARYRDGLTPAERSLFDAGKLVVRRPEAAGTNLCTAFHPDGWVEREFASGFEVVDVLPEAARGNPHQDVYLLRGR